jgi:molecular chaperone GrpE (heat shock protein)
VKKLFSNIASGFAEILTGDKGRAEVPEDRVEATVVESAEPSGVETLPAPCSSPELDVPAETQAEAVPEKAADSDAGSAEVQEHPANNGYPIKENIEQLAAEIVAVKETVYAISQVLTSVEARAAANDDGAATIREQQLIIKGYVEKVHELEDNTAFKNMVKPVLEDLFLLHDHIMSQRQSADEACRIALDAIDADLLAILDRQGIRMLQLKSSTLDTKYQMVVRADPVEPLRDNEVVGIVRDGFAMENEILRPQQVVVRKIKS